jgi:hypothetical protein
MAENCGIALPQVAVAIAVRQAARLSQTSRSFSIGHKALVPSWFQAEIQYGGQLRTFGLRVAALGGKPAGGLGREHSPTVRLQTASAGLGRRPSNESNEEWYYSNVPKLVSVCSYKGG